MAGVCDRGPRRRSRHYVEQPDRVNASQHAALGGRSSELVRNPGQAARRYGLHGYARNLPDGRVEVLACGDPNGLTALEAWLQQGPPMARVDHVSRVAADDPGMSDFRILR